MFLSFVDAMRREGQCFGLPIEPAFLELTPPSIEEALERLKRSGVERFILQPVFLWEGRHITEDIPKTLGRFLKDNPGLKASLGEPIGADPGLIAPLKETLGGLLDEQTSLLLVGRGSLRPQANAEVYKLARLIWEALKPAWVEVCFAGVTFPRLEQGLLRLKASGFEKVLVVPLLLFTGRVFQAIRQAVLSLAPGFSLLKPSWPHAPIARLLWERALAARPLSI